MVRSIGYLLDGIEKDLKNGPKKKHLIKIIPEKGFDYSKEHHPAEIHLKVRGLVCYFEGDNSGEKGDCVLNLTLAETNYPIQKDEAEKLLKQGAKIYDSERMVGFESWVEKCKETKDIRLYLNNVCDYVKGRNSNPNTRVIGFDKFTIERILKEVPLSVNIRPQ